MIIARCFALLIVSLESVPVFHRRRRSRYLKRMAQQLLDSSLECPAPPWRSPVERLLTLQ
jgi:hypothetical protein